MFKSTKLNELLASVTERTECWNAELFARQFDLHGNVLYGKFAERMSHAWLIQWTCTDTWVGIQAYYLDSELVAVSTQVARKADEYIFWVNQASFKKTYDFFYSIQTDNRLFDTIDDAITDEVIDSFFNKKHFTNLNKLL